MSARIVITFYFAGALAVCRASSSPLDPTMDQLTSNNKPMNTSKGVRCFCNLSDCVKSSYLCRSESLGCFSDLRENEDIQKGLHGCLELLPINERLGRCQNKPNTRGEKGSLFICCPDDLCNHVDSPVTLNKYNETLMAMRSQWRRGEESERLGYTDQEAVWFKVATVAVPICGALILLILIILALKILRTEPQPHQPKLRVCSSGRDTRMMEGNNPHIDTSVKKLPLLYQHNDCGSRGHEKNETNAKLNCPPSDLLDLHKSSQRAPCNLYQPLIQTPPEGENMYNKAFLIDWGSTIAHS